MKKVENNGADFVGIWLGRAHLGLAQNLLILCDCLAVMGHDVIFCKDFFWESEIWNQKIARPKINNRKLNENRSIEV